MSQLYIDEVYKADESNIFLANFQNGYLNNSFESAPGVLLQEESGKRTFATQISDFIYSGEEIVEKLGKTLLLHRNKVTGKVCLFETKSFELKPYIKSNLETAQSQDNSFLELGRKFGSKRQKKALEQVEKLKLNEKAVSEQMQNVSQNVSADQLDISTLNNSMSTSEVNYFPPCNRDAAKVEDVFPITCLLSQELLEQIYVELQLLDTSKLLPFIQQYVKPSSAIEKKTLAVYAHCLFNMSMLSMREVTVKQFDPCSFSNTLRDYIKENFFSFNAMTNRRTRPLQLKDKAICHALVAMFLISNFKFDLGDLAMSTKLPLRGVMTKISLMGGQISRKDGKVVAFLKLPLPKPVQQKSRSK